MSHPILLPGLRPLWRDPSTLQLGTDPERAVVLEFGEPAAAQVLELLDGTRTEPAVVREAVALGVPEAATQAILGSMRRARLVVEAHTVVPNGLTEPVRRRLAGELAALALRDGDRTPAEIIRRRAAARILVAGHSRLAVPIAAALAASGVGHVGPDFDGPVRVDDTAVGGLAPADTGRPRAQAAAEAITRAGPGVDIAPVRAPRANLVLQAGPAVPAGLTALVLARRGVAYLGLEIRDGAVVVGPLVPPAGSPCLNCVELHRTDRDPAWPRLAEQLATGAPGPLPCATSTALVACGIATAEVLSYLDGYPPRTLGATIEIIDSGRERRRSWVPHPRCECGRRRSRPQRGGR